MLYERGNIVDWIRQYILTITAAAIVCAGIKTLVGQKSTQATVIRIIAGIFIALTVVAPWTKLDFSNIGDYFKDFSVDAEAAAASGVSYAQAQTAAIIKSQTESYILDKAASLGICAEAEVTVSQDGLPVPYAVTIQTNAAPYTKERLRRYIVEELGIPEAQQTWI